MEGKRLLKNTVFLTVTSLSLRLAGLAFQVFLSKKMGAGGIGLFTLVMSVYGFLATLAISGIRFATTRVVSENVGSGNGAQLSATVKSGLFYALFCGITASVLLFIFAGFIGNDLIGDGRTVLSLRVLGLSLPFISCGACLSGYFTGTCRVGKSSAAAIAQELFKIAVSVILLSLIPNDDVELSCAAVVGGNAAGEMLSFFILYFLFRLDFRKEKETKKVKGELQRLTKIAVPLAFSAYARTALNTVQNLMIPKGFEKSGASREHALAAYGKIQGMVFPIMTFPAAAFYSLSEVIVPELTEEQVRGRQDRIDRASNRLLKTAMVFAFLITAVLFTLSDELGGWIYSDAEVGRYIRLLSLLMPPMYMDSVTDGMLRGLGQHLYSMRLNILDSVLTSVLIWFLLPKYAANGYIFILYASELFNFSLSIYKLSKLTKLSGLGTSLLKTAFSAVGASALASFAAKALDPQPLLAKIVLVTVMISASYYLLVRSLNVSDIRITPKRKKFSE